MSSSEYFRLVLLERINYDHQMEHFLRLQDEIAVLKEEIAMRHKKHRRCDREISKKFEVLLRGFSAAIAREFMRRILRGSCTGS